MGNGVIIALWILNMALLFGILVFLLKINRGSDSETARNLAELEKEVREAKYELDHEIKSARAETTQTMQVSFRSLGEILAEGQKASSESQDKRLAELKMQLSNMNLENEQKLENIR